MDPNPDIGTDSDDVMRIAAELEKAGQSCLNDYLLSETISDGHRVIGYAAVYRTIEGREFFDFFGIGSEFDRNDLLEIYREVLSFQARDRNMERAEIWKNTDRREQLLRGATERAAERGIPLCFVAIEKSSQEGYAFVLYHASLIPPEFALERVRDGIERSMARRPG